MLCLLARLSINTSYIKGIIRNIRMGLALKCSTVSLGFPMPDETQPAAPACGRPAEQRPSAPFGTYDDAVAELTSLLFRYFDCSGHRLQTDSHWVSFVWPLQHFKKFSICCQHLKWSDFMLKLETFPEKSDLPHLRWFSQNKHWLELSSSCPLWRGCELPT